MNGASQGTIIRVNVVGITIVFIISDGNKLIGSAVILKTKKPLLQMREWLGGLLFLYLLHPEVGESLVGFGHTVSVFFFLKCCAFAFAGCYYFTS
jgi:hypothetical protein